MHTYGVVLPIYNEGNRLTIQVFMEKVSGIPASVFVQVVDDGSTDGFGMELAEIFKNNNSISVIRTSNNVGKAEALVLGFKNIINNQADVKYLGFLDADFSAPIEEILNLFEIAAFSGTDILCGIRVPKDENLIQTSLIRRYAGITFTKISSRILGLQLQDSQCGCKVFKNSANFRSMLEIPQVNQWLFDLQAILLMKKLSRDVILQEKPLTTWIHKKGSRIKLSHLFGISFGLLKLRKYR